MRLNASELGEHLQSISCEQLRKQEGDPERTFSIQKAVSIPAPRLMT